MVLSRLEERLVMNSSVNNQKVFAFFAFFCLLEHTKIVCERLLFVINGDTKLEQVKWRVYITISRTLELQRINNVANNNG